MRRAEIAVLGVPAGVLEELEQGRRYRFSYLPSYEGSAVSLTMPTAQRVYEFDAFPPFFEGLLPEGMMLEALLRGCKLDRGDLFGQLLAVGTDMVGAVTARELQ